MQIGNYVTVGMMFADNYNLVFGNLMLCVFAILYGFKGDLLPGVRLDWIY